MYFLVRYWDFFINTFIYFFIDIIGFEIYTIFFIIITLFNLISVGRNVEFEWVSCTETKKFIS